MLVRLGREEDITAMLDLGIVMHRESGYRDYPLSIDKLHSVLLYAITSPDGLCITAVSETGEVVGGFIGGFNEHWFGHTRVAYDLALFLHPDHRGGSAGVRLLKKAFEVAKERGAVDMIVSNSTGYETERVEKLYEFVGMTRLGGVYQKRLGE